MRKFLIGVAGVAVTAATIAAAQPAPMTQPAPQPGQRMAKIMTRGEVQTMVRTQFARLDANRDGSITTEETTAIRERVAQRGNRASGGQRMERRVRVNADPAAAFDRLDANKDGSISRDEFAAGRQVRVERRVVRNGQAPAAGQRAMRMNRGGGGGMGGARMIVMADTNRDGRITLAEAETMALRHFDTMDANRDGQMTPEERRAGRGMMKQWRQAPTAG
ncbi:EF-hand domain-containing protein [Sphingomonas sp. LY160]|uniref:EF-hand domain-containing protein n=1 Tax=Sphingomonas sp. LY160 TaxID=3095342 RepID=UPI002ADEF092|nr:EF-hand domain-containing protein [Sphingomonas sp. LY160]MEA1072526.1 EF-hand domain-containing protein [Sphingomonas sp. LY160]